MACSSRFLISHQAYKGFSYSKVHAELDVSRRTRVLNRNYRTTSEIVSAAHEIIDTTVGDKETLIQNCIIYGPKPILFIAQDEEEHIEVIVRFIRQESRLLKLPTGSGAILCPSNNLAEKVASQCLSKGLPARFMKGNELKLEIPEVKVITIHSAKGLEFPIVIVPFVDQGELPNPVPENSSDDLEEYLNAQRRLFFVAATRAMRRLMVTTTAQIQSPFTLSLTEKFWDVQRA
ncbi:MAG: hypothetical protein BroJett018_30780 [Chloroflexota bacterium]|nr:hypothetical protein [Chloroflexota bacterium]NOG65093.1 ATP-binding domain-containing protein [Chloroflexota bacterium]GIK65284.1 MAG: hypothetical protein BroJett018_30780 [Chloroflexota bacterium]